MRKQIALFVMLLAALSPSWCATRLSDLAADLHRYTILVIEVNRRSACSALASECKVHISGRVVRVLNDAAHKGGLTGEFEADIVQERPMGLGHLLPWSRIELSAGSQYVVHSLAIGLVEMVQHPDVVAAVPSDQDYVGDLEFILSSAGLTVADQVSGAAQLISTSPVPRSPQLVPYLIALMMAGSSGDRARLAGAIEACSRTAFSEWAKNGLLWGVWDWLRGEKDPEDCVVHLLVTVTARYLGDAPDTLPVNVPDLRLPIARYDVPWILASERAKAMLRTELGPALAGRVRENALRLADDFRFTAVERGGMKELADLVGRPAQ